MLPQEAVRHFRPHLSRHPEHDTQELEEEVHDDVHPNPAYFGNFENLSLDQT